MILTKHMLPEIRDGNCTCPISDKGKCKHCAALLFYLIKHPGDFFSNQTTSVPSNTPAPVLALDPVSSVRALDPASPTPAPVPAAYPAAANDSDTEGKAVNHPPR